jgi:hypothetical protein
LKNSSLTSVWSPLLENSLEEVIKIQTLAVTKYRRPSLFAGLVFAVSTIRGFVFVTRICYLRIFPRLFAV